LALSWLYERKRRADARTRPVGPVRFVALAITLAIAVTGATLYLGGYADESARLGKRAARVVLAEAGFTLDHVEVRGARLAEAEEVAATLAVEPGKLIFDFDLADAKTRVETLSWVEDAVVLRLLPNRVVILVDERQPLALWGSPDGVVVLDAEGQAVEGADPISFSGLPLLEGAAAPRAAGELADALARRPALAGRVESFERVGGRRWDLRLETGTLVRLPEGELEAALDELETLEALGGVLELPLAVLDLRGEDVVMRPRALPDTVLGLGFERGA
jgi:cell division protein FtsQ